MSSVLVVVMQKYQAQKKEQWKQPEQKPKRQKTAEKEPKEQPNIEESRLKKFTDKYWNFLSNA